MEPVSGTHVQGRLYAGPAGWWSTLDEWAGEFGEVVVRFPTAGVRMVEATGRFRSDLVSGRLQHTADSVLTAHALAAETREGRAGTILAKPRAGSPHEIDAAMAAVLGWAARTDVLAEPPEPPRRAYITAQF